MKAKKNEKLRIEKDSGFFFVFGLSLVLFLTYIALEWKSFEIEPSFTEPLHKPDLVWDEEDEGNSRKQNGKCNGVQRALLSQLTHTALFCLSLQKQMMIGRSFEVLTFTFLTFKT